jgi:nucleoside-diphosphate-sugar epimerase
VLTVRVLVIGGTQFFGKRLVERLLERGDRVTVYSRGRRRPAFWDRIEHLQGDRTDRRAFVRTLRGREFDVVVDNIAYEAEDVEAALEALAGRTGQYILTSSGAVYGPVTTLRPLAEEDADLAVRTGDAYADGKRACEQVLHRDPSVPWTVLRPPVVQGPEDPTLRGWFWYQRIADGGPVLVPREAPVAVWRQIYSEDLVEAFLLAAGNPRAHGRAYNVAMEEIAAPEDFLRLAASLLGRPDPVVSVPRSVLAGAAPWYAPPFTRRFVPDTASVRSDLGFRSTPLEAWVEATVRWHLESRLPSSQGYDRRAEEIALAERFRG